MKPWSHLPNAQHIDWVISSLRTHPQEWTDAHNAAWCLALYETWGAAWHQAQTAAQTAALNSARNAISALVAYDHAGKYFDMPSDQVRVWATLSEEPAAILMLPAVVVRERIEQVEPV